MRTKTSKYVVTYSLAYVPGTVSLCDACADDLEVLERVGVLGEVQEGAHEDMCDGCGDVGVEIEADEEEEEY